MEIAVWVLVGLSLFALVAALYRLSLSLTKFKVETELSARLFSNLAPDEIEISKATPATEADLPKLLRYRRIRQRAKARFAQERQRRLIARISSINIDKRSA